MPTDSHRPSDSANSLEAATMIVALPGSAALAAALIACAMIPEGAGAAALAVVVYGTVLVSLLALRTAV